MPGAQQNAEKKLGHFYIAVLISSTYSVIIWNYECFKRSVLHFDTTYFGKKQVHNFRTSENYYSIRPIYLCETEFSPYTRTYVLLKIYLFPGAVYIALAITKFRNKMIN